MTGVALTKAPRVQISTDPVLFLGQGSEGYGSTREVTVLFGTLSYCRQTHLCLHRISPQLSYLNGTLMLPKDSTTLSAPASGAVRSFTCPFSVLAHFLCLMSRPLSLDSFMGSLFSLCPWNYPGKNTGVGCHPLLQGIFPTQGSNW